MSYINVQTRMDINLFNPDYLKIKVLKYLEKKVQRYNVKKPFKPFLVEEFGVVATILKRLFPTDPQMVNRILLQIRRCFGENTGLPLESDYDGICNRLYTLRRYCKHIEEIPTYPDSYDPDTVDFMDQYPMLCQGGVGLSRDEAMCISLSLKYVLYTAPHISKARFWGKIYGCFNDYFILECELKPEEIVRREFVKQAKLAKSCEKVDHPSQAHLSEEVNLSEENKLSETDMSAGESKSSDTCLHPLDFKILQLKDGPSILATFVFPKLPEFIIPPECITPEENIGMGTNKKVYLMSNKPYSEWCELPSVTPEQIVIGRQIAHFFTGYPTCSISSFPEFPGKEKDYLRCQIARITAATYISPEGFYEFPFSGEDVVPEYFEGDPDMCILNTDYYPMPVLGLVEPNESKEHWFHHREYILDQGRTHFWLPDCQEMDNDGEENTYYPNMIGPTMLTAISKDNKLSSGMNAWNLSFSARYFLDKTGALARSNFWPGAWAYAYDRKADNVYIGHGVKQDSYNLTPAEPPPPQAEYQLRPDEIEFPDPSVEETNNWITAHTPPEILPMEYPGEGMGEDLGESGEISD